MASASKDFSPPNYESTDGKLYWPDVNEMFDMVQIDVYEYIPISKTSIGQSTEITTLSNVQSLSNQTFTGTVDGKQVQRDRKRLSTVLLPVPNDISYTDQLQWSSENMGILGKMLPALAGAAVANQSNVGTLLSSLAQGGIPEYLLKGLATIPGAPPAESLTQGVGGKVLNPYVEQIFKGIAMREFNFSWKLVPRNAKEQERIHNIIKNLRYYSLPNYSGSSGFKQTTDPTQSTTVSTNKLSDRWLTVPNIFNLTWKQAGTSTDIQSLPKIKPCVLKNIQVNYTPDNVWATHINTAGPGLSGPAPVAYDLTMSFAETEIITADDVRTRMY
jgi:hypothetical protein